MAISYGPGLRWAIWGVCQIFHVAAQPGGMEQFLKHFDPSLFPWTKLEAPEITEKLAMEMHSGCQKLADGKNIEDLEQLRDEALIGIIEELARQKIGAGVVLNQHRRRIKTSV